MRWDVALSRDTAYLHPLGVWCICIVKAMRTLLIALLFGFPILGGAADDWPASNWIWELPRERQSVTGLLTDPEFRKVVGELEHRRPGSYVAVTNMKQQVRVVDFSLLNRPPVGIVDPRRGSQSQSIEAAEILNGLRMNGYREHCEKLKHSELRGTPALYPTQIPRFGSPEGLNTGEKPLERLRAPSEHRSLN